MEDVLNACLNHIFQYDLNHCAIYQLLKVTSYANFYRLTIST